MLEVTAGFSDDCATLLNKFTQSDSVRYSTFAQLWKQMHFSLVYAGRPLRNLLLFADEALHMVLKIMIGTESFQTRVGALYILYGLYFKMPIANVIKISVTLEEWRSIKAFINELKEDSHCDALYIIMKLVLSNAFVMAIFHKKIYRYFNNSENKLISFDNNRFQEMKIGNEIETLKKIEEHYGAAKQKLREYLGEDALTCYSKDYLSTDLMKILEDECMGAEFDIKPDDNAQKDEDLADSEDELPGTSSNVK